MEIIGYKNRYIYHQTGVVNYQINLSLDNITGESRFGFSGENTSNKIEFQAKSGKFYLNEQENLLFLQSYSVNEQVFLSGNISSDTHDLFYNNNLLFVDRPKDTGFLNLFYVNSNDVTTSLFMNIVGDSPNYSYDNFESFYSGQQIPIQIINNSSYPFRIFSGDSLNPNFYLSGANNISITDTGYIYLLSNNFSIGAQEIPIQLFTDFGLQNFYFTGSGIGSGSSSNFLIFGPNILNIESGISNSYTLLTYSSNGLDLGLSLEYISGETGTQYQNLLVNYYSFTGSGSGFISGSGYVTGYNTGIIYYNNPLIGIESGVGSGILSEYVTGYTGYYTGSGATGVMSGYINSFVVGRHFTGLWDIITGNFYTGYHDFLIDNFLESSSKYNNVIGGVDFSKSIESFDISISYNNLYSSNTGNVDIALLTITGLNINSGLSFYITGN